MAIAEAAKASSSFTQCSCRVLWSFKSNCPCEKFIDNLCTALTQAGIRSFINCDEHGRGKGFCPQMRQAIKRSRMSIIVFTNDFAFSRWCLDELVTILGRKKNGHMVLPVFYHVDPSDVRKQRGSFAEALLEYEKQIMAEESTERKPEGRSRMQSWRKSLTDAANLAGLVLEAGREFEFIQEIVEQTWIKLSFSVFSIAPYLVGVYSRIKKICLWLQDNSSSLPISVIYGASGIGKTTLAHILYQLHLERFEVSSFVPDIKGYSHRNNGLIHLQKFILLDILKLRNVELCGAHQGASKIKQALSSKKFLLVLDDVDQRDQLNAVLGLRDWIPAGSKIIITTRNETLLNPNQNCFMYKAKRLDNDESLELFSWHAFQQKHPMKGFMDLSKKIAHQCKGFPLALQVLGSSLSGATNDQWENTSQKLDGISEFHIQKLLELGYDNLHDDQEKNLFLDIACFFVGREKDYVVRVMDECDFYTTAGIQSLIDKCLVSVNQQNKLTMHQLAKEMAAEVIYRESLGEAGQCSRIWVSENGLRLLTEKLDGEFIESLSLDLGALDEDNPEDRNGSHFEDCCDNSLGNRNNDSSKRLCLNFFSKLKMNSLSTSSGSITGTNWLSTDEFSKMQNLRLLQLRGVQLVGTYERFPKRLKWLRWDKFQSRSLPLDFPMDYLAVLEMNNSNLRNFWEGTKSFRSLKVLDLSHSHCLTRSPEFSGFPRLERLILEDCKNLEEIHESIGQLCRLILLNLRGCENLQKLPKEVENLRSLRNFSLSGCLKLNFLMSTEKKEQSIILCGNRPYRNLLQNYSLSSFDRILHCFRPSRGTESASSMLQYLPCNLRSLDLSLCNLTESIPNDLSLLSSLLFLNLNENPLAELPESIKTLNSLLALELYGCKQLEFLPELPSSLRMLDARSCTSLKRITNLPNYMRSLDFQLADCGELVEIQKVFKLMPIAEIAGPINFWGGIHLKLVEGTQLEFFNNLTFTRKVAPVQVLVEFGICSMFLPGSTIPEGFNCKSTRSPVRLTMPSLLEVKRRRLDICVVYNKPNRRESEVCHKHYVTISNETKGIKWVYSPVVFAQSISSETMLWLSHWTFCDDQLGSGERVMVSLDMTFDVVEFGVSLFSDEIDEEAEHVQSEEELVGNPQILNAIGWNLCEYPLNSDVYFLAHHS